MPAVKKFAPSLHPRDRHGRFTRSRSIEASLQEKKTAAAIAAGLKPKRGITGAKAGVYLSGIGDGKHGEAVKAYTAGGYVDIHKALRAGTTDTPSVKAMDAAMTGLPDDLILSRRVPNAAFGPDGPQALAGLKVRDAAYSPTAIGTVRATKGDVRIRYAAPAGTRAAVDPDTGEVILDRDLDAVVAKVEPNSAGGFDMYVTVLPKAGVKPGVKSDAKPAEKVDTPKVGAEPAAPKAQPAKADTQKAGKHAAPAEADKPEGEEQARAELMKQRVPALQAQMRERGLKPGKKRKSELVDALVADEMGHERKPAEAKPQVGKSEVEKSEPGTVTGSDFDARIKVAATGQEALDAPALSLVRADTHSRPGNRQGLNADQRSALLDYQGGDYALINDRLRDLDQDPAGTPDEPSTQSRIDDLDAAMAGSPLARDVAVYRGITRSRTVFGDRVDANLTGMQWRESGFVSTSAAESVTSSFAGSKHEPLVMRILAPAGAHAVQVSGVTDAAGHEDEAEVLLDRGHTFKVAADHGLDSKGVRHLDVEMLPDTEQGTPAADQAKAGIPQDFDSRIAAAATDRKAIDAAPLSLLPRSREAMAAMPDTARALKKYKAGEGGDVQRALAAGGDVSAVTAGVIGDFDAGMAASKLTSDVVLYRSAPTARDVFGDKAAADLTGLRWQETPFQSVTTNRRSAVDAGGGRGMLMRILAPAGTGAVPLSSGQHPEVLLDRNHTWRVVKDHGRDATGLRQVDVEIVAKTGDEIDNFRVVKTAETTAGSPLSPAKLAALPDSPLGRGLASGITDAKALSGGEVGDVRLVTFNDGSQSVQKIAQRSFVDSSPKDLTDAEHLAGRLGTAIGAPVPSVVKTNPAEVFMDYVPSARPALSVLNREPNLIKRAGTVEGFVDSRDGRLLGVLDLVTDNRDRHLGNWLVRKDGSIIGIDHGLTWSQRQTAAADVRTIDPGFQSPFAGRFFGDQHAEEKGWRPNDLSVADIAWMREQIEALRPEFEAEGRTDWLTFSLARLDQLGTYAKGTKDRIKP